MAPHNNISDDYDYFDDAPTEDVPTQGFGCLSVLLTIAVRLLSTSYGIATCVLALAAAIGNREGHAALVVLPLKASLWLALRRFAF